MNGDAKVLNREIGLAFWKAHILHHAGQGPVVGQWMLRELWEHGYQVSPGTLYPILKRMESNGWLRCQVSDPGGLRARRSYFLTPKGRKALKIIRKQVQELYKELCLEEARAGTAGSERRS
jgi:PadR family transcriptional regulator, regulatory protein PadR